MKKNLFIAALLCSISFAGNANTAHKAKAATIVKIPMKATKVTKLEEITFNCAGGGYSIQCYGETYAAAAAVYAFYSNNLDC